MGTVLRLAVSCAAFDLITLAIHPFVTALSRKLLFTFILFCCLLHNTIPAFEPSGGDLEWIESIYFI